MDETTRYALRTLEGMLKEADAVALELAPRGDHDDAYEIAIERVEALEIALAAIKGGT